MAAVGVNQLAQFFNLTPRRVQMLVANDGMPQESRGRYDLLKCAAWYIRYLQGVESKRGGAGASEEMDVILRDHRKRMLEIERETRELALLDARKKSAPVDLMASMWATAVITVRARVMGVASELAPRMVGLKTRADAAGILTRFAEKALAELVAVGEDVEAEGTSDGADAVERRA